MYLQHFRLNEKPFSTSPDPRYFYLSTQHREALAKAEYAVTEKLGLAVVSGDIGMGKTTVSRLLLQKFRDEYKFNAVILTHPAYYYSPLSPNRLVRQARRSLGPRSLDGRFERAASVAAGTPGRRGTVVLSHRKPTPAGHLSGVSHWPLRESQTGFGESVQKLLN